MFTSNMSWDFIQLECSTCCVLTWASEVQTGWGARLLHHWWVNELIVRLFVHFERVGTSSNKCAVLTARSLKLLRTRLGCCSHSPSPNSVTSRKRVEFINLSGLHLTEHVSLRNSELRPESPTCCLLQRSIAICGPDKFEVALHVTSTGHHLMEKAGMWMLETQESLGRYHHMQIKYSVGNALANGNVYIQHLIRTALALGIYSPGPKSKINQMQIITRPTGRHSTLTLATRPHWAQRISAIKRIGGGPSRSETPTSIP